MASLKLFSKVETVLNDIIPADIKHILQECAFDTESSLQVIDADVIADIEKHVNDDREIVKNTSYENVIPFKFKPGHKIFLLQLPKQIEKLRETKIEKPKEEFSLTQLNSFSYILKTFIETSEANSSKQPKGYRYNETNRYFSTYIYLMCGRACYETLSANLPIPSSNTILGYISQSKSRFVEGELRCRQLKNYLEVLKLPLRVWLSEDATSIVSKIEFDPQTNQMVGIVLPVNSSTGMPIAFQYLARNVEEIQLNMKKSKSNSVYIVMAQPLALNVPPFIIQLFGTNNKFKSQQVLLRWKYTVEELKRHGIEVDGISADGDQRLLSSMRHNFSVKQNTSLMEHSHISEIICFLQDIIHIATKLRNRLLNLLIALVIGNRAASVTHLKMLINIIPKSIHGLVYSDICPDDRQNFDSLRRVMQPKVRDALAKYIVGSEGTIEYIRLCHEITSSLVDVNLSPLERIFFIWRSTFFLRAWRLFIKKSNSLDLDNNFLTANAYACIELNAQNLIILMKKFREIGLDEFFVPTVFNSQACEQTFRKIRSMGTMNFTKVNFTLLELMHLVGRVELMNDIVYFKLADADVCFPRNTINRVIKSQFKLPSDAEIDTTIMNASIAAVADANKFGIDVSLEDIKHCKLNDIEINMDDENSQIDDNHVDLGIGSSKIDFISDYENLKDYSNGTGNLDKSGYLNISDENGLKTVRVSSLIWNLTDSKHKLSADRINRVRGTKRNSSNRQLEFVDVTMIDKPLYKSDCIKVGDWCLFKNIICGNEEYIMGNILSFQYADGKTQKTRYYAWEYVSISQEETARKLDALALWFKLDVNGTISTFNEPKCTFISIENYCASLSLEAIEKKDEQILFSDKYISSIEKLLKCL